jgi:hypothetical protein
VKTWKRWYFTTENGEPYGFGDEQTGPTNERDVEFVMRPASDDKKVMAVYNAAMRWHGGIKTDTAEIENDKYIKLKKACEKARKK